MLTEKFQLWDYHDDVKLFVYILNDPKEFNINKKLPTVIFCPRSAYLGTSDREEEPVTSMFESYGYHMFVLRYSVVDKAKFPKPLFDLEKAITTLRHTSSQLAKKKFDFELYIFGNGKNGLLLYDETIASTPNQINEHCKCCFDLAIKWLKNMQL